jgi:hypothetical protein
MKTRHEVTIITAWDRVRQLGTVTYRQLDHWISLGLVKVETPQGEGSGNPRTITSEELAVVAHMGRLVRLGLGPRKAHDLARQFASQDWAVIDGIRMEVGS